MPAVGGHWALTGPGAPKAPPSLSFPNDSPLYFLPNKIFGLVASPYLYQLIFED